MVTWKRKVQEVNGQYRLTLPKRWVEDQDLEDKDELEVEAMKREKGLKVRENTDNDEK